MEKSLIILKPDAIRRGLIGQILSEFENEGFNISLIQSTILDEETVREHYIEHRDKSFYQELVDFLRSGMVVVMIIEGKDCIKRSRALVRDIRVTFDEGKKMENLVHGSDSEESAKREIDLHLKALDGLL